MRKIPLGGKNGAGKFALVDNEDFDKCKNFSWCLSSGGRVMARDCKIGKLMQIHRLILNFPSENIDHINRNALDNRKSNLRLCTHSQNMMNVAPRKGKRFKGVSRHYNFYRAIIHVENKAIILGSFGTEEGAARLYNLAAKVYAREFAVFNKLKPKFPTERSLKSDKPNKRAVRTFVRLTMIIKEAEEYADKLYSAMR